MKKTKVRGNKKRNISGLFSGGPSEAKQTWTEHFQEFRKRVIICIIFYVIAAAVCLYFSKSIVSVIMQLGENYSYVYVSPTEVAMTYLRVSAIGGLILALPVICLESYLYLYPGLKKSEKIVCIGAILFGILFFSMGSFFCYRLIMPLSITFLNSLNSFSNMQDMISIENFLSFVTTMLLVFGLIFEFPVISVLLTITGILDPNILKKIRKYIFLMSFVIAALITPPDVVTQLLVAFPLIILFELSVIICMIIYKVRQRRENKKAKKAGKRITSKEDSKKDEVYSETVTDSHPEEPKTVNEPESVTEAPLIEALITEVPEPVLIDPVIQTDKVC